MLPAEGLRPHPSLWDTWRLRTPLEWSAEPWLAGVWIDTWRSRTRLGVRMGTWRSRTRLWGSESTAEGSEHLHLWDTWRHRIHPRAVEWVRGRWLGETESDRRGLATQVLGA